MSFQLPYSHVLGDGVESARLRAGGLGHSAGLALLAVPLRLEVTDLRTAWGHLQVPHWFSNAGKLETSVRLSVYFKDSVSSMCLMMNFLVWLAFSSVSQSVVSDSLGPHGLQHSRLPVHHQLLEFTQTHVHRVGDAIQTSHPLSSPSPPAFSLSQHQGLFQWVGSSHQVAKVLEFQLQHQSCQWIFRTDFGWTGWISLQSKGLSRVFSNTTVQKHQFFSAQLSLQKPYFQIKITFTNNKVQT